MTTITDSGTMIVQTPEIRKGRPRITATGVTVRRIASWYQLGLSPEEITRKYANYLSLDQVAAALAYYHASQAAIDADLAAEAAAAERLEREHYSQQRNGS